ncbi:uncharacterized protein L969DRAFT_54333 [Mixia osmundae IAM 14324]|uniref:Cx9C motif-containing protein 4, mitochondrial n=1 Tax=Mixia osmundae (strain CBS 9802 / IAM 14324 / JCM 22182 / KY 12970) TaxID=764103 RepID=G7E2K9_MIXOS|nr:uncharacterized protein L969DRAFT_54333 [Mixia osmundae IAM 14324]KEI36937.1 hypothetical protein L969DRAFT_54333 [Mixia osmundae IAM 14324]GAA97069.1 hypothetical protein E5Q_03744 [Mixia osmundae IAM 14324]
MPVSEDPPCQMEACAIQTCLSRNSYNQERCQSSVTALYKCCAEMYEREGGGDGSARRRGKGEKGDAGSTACPLRSVVLRKLKDLER